MVKLSELDKNDVEAALQFNSRLSPLLWNGDDLLLDVRLRLFRTALEFYRFLELPKLGIQDIVLTGSNAAFNYTKLSDIDVHLVVDYSKMVCSDIAANFFTTKKSLWNLTYDISIKGLPVELYVEDDAHPAESNGRYSILNGSWVKRPSQTAPRKTDRALFQKVAQFSTEIDRILDDQSDPEGIAAMFAKLRRLRQNGLIAGGEFSTENLTYKVLRNLGYLDRLWKAKITDMSSSLSL